MLTKQDLKQIDGITEKKLEEFASKVILPAFAGLENKMASFEDKMTGLENKMASFEDKMTGLENKMATKEWIDGIFERKLNEKFSRIFEEKFYDFATKYEIRMMVEEINAVNERFWRAMGILEEKEILERRDRKRIARA